MKLIFKNESFSDDFRDLLGFVDADIKLIHIKSELITATKELIDIVGAETFQLAVDVFESESPNDEDLDLLYFFRYPIALNAYRYFAPSNDLSHSKNGRMMRVEENEKAAFQWMIDQNNKVLERKYYRSLNDLFDFISDKNTWKESDHYKKLNQNIVKSLSDFNNYFVIDSLLLLFKLRPALTRCEQEVLIPIIGKTEFEALKETPSSNQELYNHCQAACVYYALEWAMTRLSLQLFPEGLLQQYVGDQNTTIAKQIPQNKEQYQAQQSFASDLRKSLNKIEILCSPNDNSPIHEDFNGDDKFVTT